MNEPEFSASSVTEKDQALNNDKLSYKKTRRSRSKKGKASKFRNQKLKPTSYLDEIEKFKTLVNKVKEMAVTIPKKSEVKVADSDPGISVEFMVEDVIRQMNPSQDKSEALIDKQNIQTHLRNVGKEEIYKFGTAKGWSVEATAKYFGTIRSFGYFNDQYYPLQEIDNMSGIQKFRIEIPRHQGKGEKKKNPGKRQRFKIKKRKETVIKKEMFIK